MLFGTLELGLRLKRVFEHLKKRVYEQRKERVIAQRIMRVKDRSMF